MSKYKVREGNTVEHDGQTLVAGKTLELSDAQAQPLLDANAVRPQDSDDSSGEPEVTPAARTRARELQIDLNDVEGTGDKGKITVPDVERTAEKSA